MSCKKFPFIWNDVKYMLNLQAVLKFFVPT